MFIRDRNTTSLNDKDLGENRDTRNMLNIIKAIYSKTTANNTLKWRETLSDSTEIKNKKRLSILSISIQHIS